MSTDHDVDSGAASPSTGSAPGSGTGFGARIGRVFSFDTSVYEEVAAAPATPQAVIVIAVAAMLSGSLTTLFLFIFVVPGALFFVAVHAFLVMMITRLFGGRAASFVEWYRAIGFAQAPLAIGLVPLVGWVVAPLYCAAAQVAAISRVARISAGFAILALLLAWLPFFLLGGLRLLLGVATILGILGAASMAA